ncbi:MAG: arsenosugar biosynthesis radical SAM protein ArsS [Candidatus Hydrogenedentes bacterium]|nr:arsenosugar biosynthesis radical SAM protein ArsS [Candidatus Hydrogenedentota bacterium]
MSLAQSSVFQALEDTQSFNRCVEDAIGENLTGLTLDTVQVNIGLKCNLACRHCHVVSSPKRKEEMSWETMQAVLRAAQLAGAHTLDITGGAPEMHPDFREFVDVAIVQGLHVMVRTNLTILLQPGYEGLPAFFADRAIHLVASLPCYLPNNVDKQRGRHVYKDSITAIQRLNQLGYGRDSAKVLDLVCNPGGPSLPPNERELEEAYRRALHGEFGIHFNKLHAITNIAIGRFLHDLARAGKIAEYQWLLRESFNPATLEGLMCRHQLHVGWDGTMYDCDFNSALHLAAAGGWKVQDFDPVKFRQRRIVTGEHCFACTAGCGSSCGGALT